MAIHTLDKATLSEVTDVLDEFAAILDHPVGRPRYAHGTIVVLVAGGATADDFREACEQCRQYADRRRPATPAWDRVTHLVLQFVSARASQAINRAVVGAD